MKEILPDDLPSTDTRTPLRYATEVWNEVMMPEFRDAKEYVAWLKTLPPHYKGIVNSEIRRIADKWYQPEQPAYRVQPKPRKAKDYDAYEPDERDD